MCLIDTNNGFEGAGAALSSFTRETDEALTKTKAAEAASELLIANTHVLKPTQRCHQCGTVVKKTLKDRSHACACGAHLGRDKNAAKTILRWMLEGDYWSGTSQGVATLQETPSIARSA